MKKRRTSTFINHFGKPTSLTCNVYVALKKEFNIKRILIFPSIRFKQEKANLIDLKTAEFCISKAKSYIRK